jgi:F-type H+-transporting ATPase subunit epsilon
MSVQKLRLTIVTPERAVLEGAPCDSVTLPAESGEIGVLPLHTPMITLLGTGVVAWRDMASTGRVAVRGGFAEIGPEVVRVLADAAVLGEDVDRTAVAREKAQAEDRRLTVAGDEHLAAVNADVDFADARLKVAAG